MRYRRMVEMYGADTMHRCGDCVHHKRVTAGCKNVYKCELWMKLINAGSSHATDIRLKDQACRKFEEVRDES